MLIVLAFISFIYKPDKTKKIFFMVSNIFRYLVIFPEINVLIERNDKLLCCIQLITSERCFIDVIKLVYFFDYVLNTTNI